MSLSAQIFNLGVLTSEFLTQLIFNQLTYIMLLLLTMVLSKLD